MPVSQKPRKPYINPKTNQRRNPITSKNGIPVNTVAYPFKFITVFKYDSKGKIRKVTTEVKEKGRTYTVTKPMIDWKKSCWVVDTNFNKKYPNKNWSVYIDKTLTIAVGRFKKPTKKPKNSSSSKCYLDYCNDDEYFVLTKQFRKSDKRKKQFGKSAKRNFSFLSFKK